MTKRRKPGELQTSLAPALLKLEGTRQKRGAHLVLAQGVGLDKEPFTYQPQY